MNLCFQKVGSLQGVGEKREQLLNKLGIETIYDLIYFFPRTYEDRTQIKGISEIRLGETVCVRARVATAPYTATGKNQRFVCRLKVMDEMGKVLELVFFNCRYIAKRLLVGREYVFFGKIDPFKMQMVNPDFEEVSEGVQEGRILPVYKLTAGITRRMMISLMEKALTYAANLEDSLPDSLREKYHFSALAGSLHAMHFPNSMQQAELAEKRFFYEEAFSLCLRLQQLRKWRHSMPSFRFEYTDLSAYTDSLPYQLTLAQQRVIRECISDVSGTCPMNRLVQGDVGCGKTIVAGACLYLAAKNGYQSAFMVPTEILANQHFHSLSTIFERFGMNVVLLTGSMKKSERDCARNAISDGTAQIVIGTHALLTEQVVFQRLAFVVTDEQHRFGVAQRSQLAEKSEKPHIMVMSATPIPRTLALIIFGDLDISVIDELPAGRIPVDTFLVNDTKRNGMYGFLRNLVLEGRQGYIVCPAIDENDALEMKAVLEYSRDLCDHIFPDFQIAVLHSKMKADEKRRTMQRFAAGEIQILVSTTVIEVGVDVPNAAFMVVENAERFGLSTLHQLRGRVGRGKDKSYCILMSNTHSRKSYERLTELTKTNDGFLIAQADLNERGPGEFFSHRQHGLPDFISKTSSFDMRWFKKAEEDAASILENDPEFLLPEHQKLKQKIEQHFFSDNHELNRMN